MVYFSFAWYRAWSELGKTFLDWETTPVAPTKLCFTVVKGETEVNELMKTLLSRPAEFKT